MTDVFIGSDAVRHGRSSPYQLRTGYRASPRRHLPDSAAASLRTRSEAAWLWSGGRAVFAGLAAAALHGSNWIDDDGRASDRQTDIPRLGDRKPTARR